MGLRETAYAAVAAEPPCVPVAAVENAVQQQFGLRGVFVPLVSERDQNFRLETPSGSDYVVKVSSSAEPAIVTAFHIAALEHLENIAVPGVPKVARTLDGQGAGDIVQDGTTHKLRVVSHLAGVPLADVRIRRAMARYFGTALARLDIGLQGFSHAGDRPRLLWDLQRAAELSGLLDHISDLEIRRAVAVALNDFTNRIMHRSERLRRQVIHGDANPGNVLIDPQSERVTGFIDFGDSVNAPTVFDVAIAAAYLRPRGEDPVDLIAPFVSAYHVTNPLQDVEVALLFDLVRARLATTITLLFWRLNARQDHDPYRQKTLAEESGAVRFLEALDAVGRTEFTDRLARATSG